MTDVSTDRAARLDDEPIDFVITWLDGDDPAWQREKKRYDPTAFSDTKVNRFRNWDNLQYLLRGIEKFAPWVNKVHLVTWGHLPAWLDTSYEKLHVVRHEDFMPAEYLPTFSSVPLDLNLHRIPGLAERFVFFCDDYFLLQPLSRTDFFKKGLPCDAAVISPIIPVPYTMINHIILNEVECINRHFTKQLIYDAPSKWFNPRYGLRGLRTPIFVNASYFPGFTLEHLPQPFLKSTFEAVWEAEGELLDEVSRHRYRTNRDVSQFLMKTWQLCSNDFMPRRFGLGEEFLIENDNDHIVEAIRNRTYKMVCLNDSEKIVDFATVKLHINGALDSVLPERSAFEREPEDTEERYYWWSSNQCPVVYTDDSKSA